MDKIKQALIMLFASKGTLTEEKGKLIKFWLTLIDKYKLTGKEVLYAVERLMVKPTYGLQFADLYNEARPDTIDSDALIVWNGIRESIRENILFTDSQMALINKFTTSSILIGADSETLDYLKHDFVKIYKNDVYENNKYVGMDNVKRIDNL